MVVCKRKSLFERGPAKHPITPGKTQLLRYIAECSFLSLPQVARIGGISEKSARDHMRDLFDHGLVSRIGVPRAVLCDTGNGPELLYGSAPTIYACSRSGRRVLVRNGHIESNDARVAPRFGPRNALFLSHELQVREVRVWLECLSRVYGHPGMSIWKDGSRAVLLPARPDAVFVYKLSGATLCGLVEVDRDTMRSPARWEAKFKHYSKVFATNTVMDATGHERARVIITTPSERRRDTLASLIEKLLPRSHIPPERFWITTIDTLQRTDLMEANWRIPGREGLVPLVPERLLREE